MKKFFLVAIFIIAGLLFVGCSNENNNSGSKFLPLLENNAVFPPLEEGFGINTKVVVYDSISETDFNGGIAYLVENNFTKVDDNRYIKYEPILGISEVTVMGDFIDGNYYLLLSITGSEISKDLFEQIFPKINGREVVVASYKTFDNMIRDYGLVDYKEKLTSSNFEVKNNKYYKKVGRLYYIYWDNPLCVLVDPLPYSPYILYDDTCVGEAVWVIAKDIKDIETIPFGL
ncbi:MAG: hypothetical protein LBG21_02485 [Campylobacteraceae bacterium]|jgi:hypothetical protein|nr:hypothetical protein [Campylobacteraceae bacterium]